MSAFGVKVLAASKYIFIAGEQIKITAIKSFRVYSEDVPVEAKIDKEHTVLSVGLLMNNIRPKEDVKSGEMRSLQKLSVTTFQNSELIFSEDEIDIAETVKILKAL